MEWRSLNKSVGEDGKKNNHNSVGTIFNPSPDETRARRDPDPPDPIQIPTRPEPVTRYRECQKNHSAHLGTHVLDGCGEFMPDGTLESLTCAACACHRNFHRKEASTPAAAPTPTSNFQISFSNAMTPFPYRQAPALRHHQAPPTMMNFGEGGDASSEDLNPQGYGGSSRKRFRTKFTQEQKDGMMELADKIGWRIHKEDESHVQQFCAATGVKREVFKVWMHNNKQAIKRKQS